MSTRETQRGIPQPVSTIDLRGLKLLSERYGEVKANDVSTIRGETVEEILARSQMLAEKLANGLGAVSSDETVTVGFVELSEEEKSLLESSRRVLPAPRRLY